MQLGTLEGFGFAAGRASNYAGYGLTMGSCSKAVQRDGHWQVVMSCQQVFCRTAQHSILGMVQALAVRILLPEGS